MNHYEDRAFVEMVIWQKKMQRPPGILNRISKRTQERINALIPEKMHQAVTAAIKQMIRAVLFGAKYTTAIANVSTDLSQREAAVKEKIKFYRNTAAVEGGVTGAGGFFLGLADFPILLTIKLKLLYEIATLYGFNLNDYRERVYLLHIFELAFSSPRHRQQVYKKMADWKTQLQNMPEDINAFHWRTLQQEYRDYIDLAKIAQLLPVIGAPVGLIANYHLIKKLGTTAINAYRMRIFEKKEGF